jgi:hypothetical protein
MRTIRNCNESEVIQQLRGLKNEEVNIYKNSIYIMSSNQQFNGELKYLSKANSLNIKICLN